MKGLIFTLMLGSAAAWAGSSFHAKVERLRAGQSGVDQALRQLGRSAGIEVLGDARASGQAAPRSLFQVHGSMERVRFQQGRLLFGRLLNRLVVGPDGAPTLIELDPDQNLGSGVRFLGMARQAGAEGRVGVEITRLLLPGKSVALQAAALDLDGAFGLTAEVWSHKGWKVAGAMASSFVSGLAAAQQSQTTSPLGFSQVQPTGRNALLQGVAQTGAEQSKRLIEEATADKPILVVEAGVPVTVLIQEEVRW